MTVDTAETPIDEGIERGRAAIPGRALMLLLAEIAVLVAVAYGAIARESSAGSPTDPVALALRVVALALLARVVVALAKLAPSLRAAFAASGTTLAFEPARLVLRHRGAERVIARDSVLAVAQIGAVRGKEGGDGPVVLVTAPDSRGNAIVELPPVFDRPASLAERLMRWAPPHERRERSELPRPSELPSKQYDDAAAGRPPVGAATVPLGHAFLRRGPFAGTLLGVAVLDTWARAEDHAWGGLPSHVPVLVGAILLASGLAWLALQQRSVAPRKGLAMLVTPAEVLFRTKSGVLRASFAKLTKARIESIVGWSLLDGAHAQKTLVLEREGDDPILCDGAYVAAPIEAVLALCEAYQRGAALARLDLDREA